MYFVRKFRRSLSVIYNCLLTDRRILFMGHNSSAEVRSGVRVVFGWMLTDISLPTRVSGLFDICSRFVRRTHTQEVARYVVSSRLLLGEHSHQRWNSFFPSSGFDFLLFLLLCEAITILSLSEGYWKCGLTLTSFVIGFFLSITV